MQLITMTSADKPRHDTSEQCITNILPVEVMSHIFGTFLGHGHYHFVAGTCRAFADAYRKVITQQNKYKTTWESAAASVACAQLCLNEANSVEWVAFAAARNGQVNVIEANSVECVAFAAARNGQVNVVDLCYKNGFNYYWEWHLFSEAAKYGQIKVFEYGIKNRLTWDDRGVAASAAKCGHIYVLEWMRQHGAKDFAFQDCAQKAAECGKLSVLEWLQRQQLPIEDMESCFCNAANNGHTNVLDWLLHHDGFHLYRNLMDSAARFGHIKLMKIALERGVQMNTKTCAIAAFNGRLNALQWLRLHGCQWDGNVIHWAQENDNQEVVDWAKRNGCPDHCERKYSFMDLYHVA
jgi:ankyrin repeat protein